MTLLVNDSLEWRLRKAADLRETCQLLLLSGNSAAAREWRAELERLQKLKAEQEAG